VENDVAALAAAIACLFGEALGTSTSTFYAGGGSYITER
jgi:hypothetical protein